MRKALKVVREAGSRGGGGNLLKCVTLLIFGADAALEATLVALLVDRLDTCIATTSVRAPEKTRCQKGDAVAVSSRIRLATARALR